MKYLIYSIICLLVVVCRADRPMSVREIFKDSARMDMLYHPDRVEVCMWYPKSTANKAEPGYSLAAYNAGKHVLLQPDVADLITWKLTTDENYAWNIAVDGEMVLHTRVSYYKGGHALSMDFNFSCDIVVFSYDGKEFSDALFQQGSDWVFRIVERTFPKDRVVQAIQRNKERLRSFRLDCEIVKATEAKKKREANQALVPTPASVTPAADAPVAPDAGAAHL